MLSPRFTLIFVVFLTFHAKVAHSNSIRLKRSDSFEIFAAEDEEDSERNDWIGSGTMNKVSSSEDSSKIYTNQISDVLNPSSRFRGNQAFLRPKNNRDEIHSAVELKVQNVVTKTPATDIKLAEARDLRFDIQCTACIAGAKLLFLLHSWGWSSDAAISSLSVLCSVFKIESTSVCHGIVRSVGLQLFAVLDQSDGSISSKDLCGMVYGGSCAQRSQRLNDWSLDIPDLNSDPPTQPPIWPADGVGSTEKILHLSDSHIQLDYTAGMTSKCDKPVCCTKSDGPSQDPATSAGRFGDYHCDLPQSTFDEMMRQAKATHPDIKYIFLTGDFPAHDIWRQNRDMNIGSIKVVADVIQKHFPDVKVFPAVGNHESFPVNMFPDPNVTGDFSPSWLYSGMAAIYKSWLPGENQQRTLKDGGYYTFLLRPNLRVISMNTNFCNNLNFWLMLNFTDPHDHLHWVYKQLHKAEFNKERVYILGHIPPGSESCLERWSHEYNRIVVRFRNTIVGQFFGHTHFDEFELFFSPKSKKAAATSSEAINIAYLAPSQTPHDGLNPAYRVFTIDGDHNGTTNLILDHQTFWMNLTESNQIDPDSGGQFQMTQEYSARSDLGLENMSPKSWFNFVTRMAVNDDADDFDKFRRFYSRSGTNTNYKTFRPYLTAASLVEGKCPFYSGNICDNVCKKKLLCSLVTSRSGDSSICDEIKSMIVNPKKAASDDSVTLWKYLWPTSLELSSTN